MAGEKTPPFPPDDGPGATMVSVPRPGANRPPPLPPEATAPVDATMIGVGRIPSPFGVSPIPVARPVIASAAPPNFAGMAMPIQTMGADPGATMVGMGRVPPAQELPDTGATFIGTGRVLTTPNALSAHDLPDPGSTMIGFAAPSSPAPVASFAAPARPAGPPANYDILAHLGGGDLGEVYYARHKESGYEAALRVFRPEIISVPGAVEALRDVVSLAAAAQHTHLGKQLALDESGTPTLVVEYVPGKQLVALMRDRGPAPAAAVIDLGVRLCSALAAAHAAGLAHGRVHAGNVILEAKTGRWVILDVGHGYAMQGLEPSHDLYALGALLYEMATGHGPFDEGDTAPDPRSFQPKLPASLSALLLRTLSPTPAVWFASAVELAQALARARNAQ